MPHETFYGIRTKQEKMPADNERYYEILE